MVTFAILGGGGSFGIHAAIWLLNKGHKVIGIGRNPLRDEPFSLGVNEYDNYKYATYHVTHELDLLLEFLDKEQPEVIVNFAAQGEGAVSWQHSWRFFETNAMALARLAEALEKRSYLKRFIQIGTSECYGSVEEPVDEFWPLSPSSPYAASKVAFDWYLESVWRVKGFPMNIIRPSNAYCPGQLLHRVIPRAIVSGILGQKLPLQGGGGARKSYIHARDLSSAIDLVADKAPLGEIYNVGPEQPTKIRDVVEMCAKALDMPFEDLISEAPGRFGEDACYWLDSSKIRDLGWEPRIGWDQGLKEMVDWANEYKDQLYHWPTDYQLRA